MSRTIRVCEMAVDFDGVGDQVHVSRADGALVHMELGELSVMLAHEAAADLHARLGEYLSDYRRNPPPCLECNGSGEGRADRTTCPECHGTGRAAA